MRRGCSYFYNKSIPSRLSSKGCIFMTAIMLFYCGLCSAESSSVSTSSEKVVVCGRLLFESGDRLIANGSEFDSMLIIRDRSSLEYMRNRYGKSVEFVASVVDSCGDSRSNDYACIRDGGKALLFHREKEEGEMCGDKLSLRIAK